MPDLLDDILPSSNWRDTPTPITSIELIPMSGNLPIEAPVRLPPATHLHLVLPAEYGPPLEQLAVLMKMAPIDVVAQLIRRAAPSPNGSAGYEVACFGCGKKFTVGRRPVPGKRSWCDTCKASGEPAAQRARDYRSRKEAKT